MLESKIGLIGRQLFSVTISEDIPFWLKDGRKSV